MQVVTFVVNHKVELLAFGLAVSELLSLIPSVKANGIFQFVWNLLKKAKPE